MLKHSALKSKPAGAQWFRRGFGRWVAREEKRLCRDTLADVLGLYAVQLGADNGAIGASPVRHKILITRSQGDLLADWHDLPLESESLDLVVLAHTLEAAQDQHAVLREAVRALRPEGRLVIIGFNRWSLLALSRQAPWRGRWLSVARISDWLALLEMQPMGGAYAVFLPPWRQALTRRWRLRWLELAGRRWWPLTGGIFVLHSVKRRHAMRLIIPRGFKRSVKKPALASYNSAP